MKYLNSEKKTTRVVVNSIQPLIVSIIPPPTIDASSEMNYYTFYHFFFFFFFCIRMENNTDHAIAVRELKIYVFLFHYFSRYQLKTYNKCNLAVYLDTKRKEKINNDKF